MYTVCMYAFKWASVIKAGATEKINPPCWSFLPNGYCPYTSKHACAGVWRVEFGKFTGIKNDLWGGKGECFSMLAW